MINSSNSVYANQLDLDAICRTLAARRIWRAGYVDVKVIRLAAANVLEMLLMSG